MTLYCESSSHDQQHMVLQLEQKIQSIIFITWLFPPPGKQWNSWYHHHFTPNYSQKTPHSVPVRGELWSVLSELIIWFISYIDIFFKYLYLILIDMLWASCQIRKIVGCACTGNAGNIFSTTDFKGNRQLAIPALHHGTCVTHVPWCMSGSLTSGGGENVPSIPGACATRNFTYLLRGPWPTHEDVIWVHFLSSKADLFLDFVTCSSLTYWGWDKMAEIFQTTFSFTFSWMKMLQFRLKFLWSLFHMFQRVQLTIFQYWFR